MSNSSFAVVFDFDGTLTLGKYSKTTWESLWTELGYDVRVCQELHKKYDRKEITHSQWCMLTQENFISKHLKREMVVEIAKQIKLISGIEETFIELKNKDIKIYIVSGSIGTVIDNVLGDLTKYIEIIKANQFRYDESGNLIQIIGTNYDFEGKANFITEIAEELKISTKDILFVGNSINDRFACTSGAKTLCINPKLVDPTNSLIWNDCIQTCEDLREILNYI